MPFTIIFALTAFISGHFSSPSFLAALAFSFSLDMTLRSPFG
jgi:hypothetical protein